VTAPLIPEDFTRGRLAYERVRAEHADELAALMAEPKVLATLWPWPEPPSPADLERRLDIWTDHWNRHGFGLWVLRDAASGDFVGRGGLAYNDIDGATVVEVAWAVTPARWGEGLATELAGVSVQMAFERLELNELTAITMTTNTASRRVMEKSGFRCDRHIVHAGLEHVLYLQHPAESPR
jgi:[ribosomal protein S5]-alanine N-acetyltransferase